MSDESRSEQLAAADGRADLQAILMIFTVAVLAAVYFVSGWVPGI